MIINLISGPRNISTALMYSFAQRPDTKVVDEPFYAYYLVETGVEHPGSDETILSMPDDQEVILKDVDELSKNNEIVFLKNMAHHHIGLEWSYLKSMRNVFLIRDPKQLIASFAQVLPRPTIQDIGLKIEAGLFDYVQENGDYDPIVIDSNTILKDPEKGISILCEQLEIPFEQAMLSWEAGPIPEDGTWAKYWYHNVHKSTGFSRQKTSDRALPKHCKSLYKEALPFYEKLSAYL